MDSIKERFEQKLDAGVFDDVEQKRASGYDIKAFIKEELNKLADDVLRNGHSSEAAATIIRTQADLL